MEVGQQVWVKNPTVGIDSSEPLWLAGTVTALRQRKGNDDDKFICTINVPFLEKQVTTEIQGLSLENAESGVLQLRNAVPRYDLEDLSELPYLNEPEIIDNLFNRLCRSLIYAFTGNIFIAVNPGDEVIPMPECDVLMRKFTDGVCNSIISELKVLREEEIESGTLTDDYDGVTGQSTSLSTKSPRPTNYNQPKLSIQPHAILISGESGSGKTECSKALLKSFNKRNTSFETEEWFSRVVSANQMLESFGNAQTLHTANSSRYGKLLDLKIDELGHIVGCEFRSYLLESTRTSRQHLGERNFNIFYQLVAGADERQRIWWSLETVQDYYYINQGGDDITSRSPDIDLNAFNTMLFHAHRTGLDAEMEIDPLLDVVVAVLKLGNITFTPDDRTGGCTITNPHYLEMAASMLAVDKDQFRELLTEKLFVSPRGENIRKPMTVKQAEIARDAVAKFLYKSLFDWLVWMINAKLSLAQADKNNKLSKLTGSVLLVDIFGFDSFVDNSIEQLCINYCNEILQQLFNYHIFKNETEVYEREGMKIEQFQFLDNQDNIDLIVGMFKILDDQCRLPSPTDQRFYGVMAKKLEDHPLFTATRNQLLVHKFSISHYAGDVEYSALGFVSNNTDSLPSDTSKILSTAQNRVLHDIYIFQDAIIQRQKRGSSSNTINPPSFVEQMKSDMAVLLKRLKPTSAHYVRCLIAAGKATQTTFPENMHYQQAAAVAMQTSHAEQQQQHSAKTRVALRQGVLKRVPSFQQHFRMVRFDQHKLAEQLHYGGIIDALKTARLGFRARVGFAEFYRRYRVIANEGNGIFHFQRPQQFGKNTAEEVVKDACCELICVLANASVHKTVIEYFIDHHNGEEPTPDYDREALLDLTNMPIGQTLVFIKKADYQQLEFLRNQNLTEYILTVQRILLGNYYRITYLKKCYAVRLMQRALRGYWGRYRAYTYRLRLLATVSLQRRFRKKRFFNWIITIQCAFRSCVARQVAEELRRLRDRLLKLYGPLILARSMRGQRRRQLIGISFEATSIAANTHFPVRIKALEHRQEAREASEQQISQQINDFLAGVRLKNNISPEAYMDFSTVLDALSSSAATLSPCPLRMSITLLYPVLASGEKLLKSKALLKLSLLGKYLGPRVWKALPFATVPATSSFFTSSVDQIAEVNAQHKLFSRIWMIIKKLEELEDRATDEVDHTQVKKLHLLLNTEESETTGITRLRKKERNPQAIMRKLEEQLLALRRVQTDLFLMKKYYVTFIDLFCKEYGHMSKFRSHYSTEDNYLRRLVEVILRLRQTTDFLLMHVPTVAAVKTAYDVAKTPLRLDWDESLETWKSMQESSVFDSLRGDDAGIIQQLFDLNQRKVDFWDDNLRVLHYEGLGYQYMPHHPGVGYAINSMASLFKSKTMSAQKILRVSGAFKNEGKVSYYLASEALRHTTCVDILYNPLRLEQIEHRSFSAMMLTTVLLGLTHLQPNHVIIDYDFLDQEVDSAAQVSALLRTQTLPHQQRGHLQRQQTIRFGGNSPEIELLSFNNDEKLTNRFLTFHDETASKISSDNLSFLYFMPQMDEAVDTELQVLLAQPLIAEELVANWLRDLYEQNLRYAKLRENAGFTASDFEALDLPICLPSRTSLQVLERLKKVTELFAMMQRRRQGQAASADDDNEVTQAEGNDTDDNKATVVTHTDCLNALYPELTAFYLHHRLDGDFREHTDQRGIISYAWIYHEAIDEERAKEDYAKDGISWSHSSSSLSLKRVGGRKGSMLKRQRSAMTSLKSLRSRHSSLFSFKDSDLVFVNQGDRESDHDSDDDNDDDDEDDNEINPQEKQSFIYNNLKPKNNPLAIHTRSVKFENPEAASSSKKATLAQRALAAAKDRSPRVSPRTDKQNAFGFQDVITPTIEEKADADDDDDEDKDIAEEQALHTNPGAATAAIEGETEEEKALRIKAEKAAAKQKAKEERLLKEKVDMRDRLRRAQSLARKLKKEQEIQYFSTVLAKTAEEIAPVTVVAPVAPIGATSVPLTIEEERGDDDDSECEQEGEEDEPDEQEHVLDSPPQLPAVLDLTELHEELVAEVQELHEESSSLQQQERAAPVKIDFPILRRLSSHTHKHNNHHNHRQHHASASKLSPTSSHDASVDSSRFDLLHRVDGLMSFRRTPAAERSASQRQAQLAPDWHQISHEAEEIEDDTNSNSHSGGNSSLLYMNHCSSSSSASASSTHKHIEDESMKQKQQQFIDRKISDLTMFSMSSSQRSMRTESQQQQTEEEQGIVVMNRLPSFREEEDKADDEEEEVKHDDAIQVRNNRVSFLVNPQLQIASSSTDVGAYQAPKVYTQQPNTPISAVHPPAHAAETSFNAIPSPYSRRRKSNPVVHQHSEAQRSLLESPDSEHDSPLSKLSGNNEQHEQSDDLLRLLAHTNGNSPLRPLQRSVLLCRPSSASREDNNRKEKAQYYSHNLPRGQQGSSKKDRPFVAFELIPTLHTVREEEEGAEEKGDVHMSGSSKIMLGNVREHVGGHRHSSRRAHMHSEARKEAQQGQRPLVPVLEEAFDFLAALDWRLFEDTKPRERLFQFYSAMGQALAFLPTLWLNHPSPRQLKEFFRPWLSLPSLKERRKAVIKLHTKELVLRFDSLQAADELQRHCIVVRLQRRLHLEIKFAVSCAAVGFAAKSVEAEQQGPFDIFAFNPTWEEMDEGQDSDDDPREIASADLRQRLLGVLWSCSNLLRAESGYRGTSAMQHEELREVSARVKVVKAVIKVLCLLWAGYHHLGNKHEEHKVVEEEEEKNDDNDAEDDHDSHQHHYKHHHKHAAATPSLDFSTFKNFCRLLLDYPGLAPIATEMARQKIFSRDKQMMHALLSHPMVERYVETILAILTAHPEVLVLQDINTGFLPCDVIKRISEDEGVAASRVKYRLFAHFINFAAEGTQRSFQLASLSSRNTTNPSSSFGVSVNILGGGGQHGICSAYRGDEELIVWAAHFDFPATPTELKGRRCDLNKRDLRYGEGLLVRLLIEEASAGTDRAREAAYHVYQLFTRVLRERMLSRQLAPLEIENMIWQEQGLNLKGRTQEELARMGLLQEDESRIMADLREHWSTGTIRAPTLVAMRRDFNSSMMSSFSESSSTGKKGAALISEGFRRLVQGGKKLTQSGKNSDSFYDVLDS